MPSRLRHPNPDLARSPRPRPPELPCSRSWLCPAARGCSLNGPVSAPFRPFRPSLASGRRCACLFTASQDHHLPSFPVQNRADSPPCRIALECSFLKRAGGFASRLTQPPFLQVCQYLFHIFWLLFDAYTFITFLSCELSLSKYKIVFFCVL